MVREVVETLYQTVKLDSEVTAAFKTDLVTTTTAVFLNAYAGGPCHVCVCVCVCV